MRAIIYKKIRLYFSFLINEEITKITINGRKNKRYRKSKTKKINMGKIIKKALINILFFLFCSDNLILPNDIKDMIIYNIVTKIML
jgi:hypothetical protein